MNNIKYIKGDLIVAAKNNLVDVVVHGCNCFCTMGAGIAKSIKKEWPGAYQSDCKTEKGDRNKLGTLSIYKASDSLEIVNAYTQFTYWDTKDMLSYVAIKDCMNAINSRYDNKIIGTCLIGSGLAGGSWPKIEQIIKDVFLNSSNKVHIYKLQ